MGKVMNIMCVIVAIIQTVHILHFAGVVSSVKLTALPAFMCEL